MSDALKELERVAGDPAFQERFAAVKRANKAKLANLIAQRLGIPVDPSALFDVQIKRIHEYKRQLLNMLETIAHLQRHPRPSRPQLGAAGEDLRRQGGRQLPAGQDRSSS